MNNIWVCKHDGSIQCEKSGGTSLEEMKKELARLIGAEHILKMERRSVNVIQVCGSPTSNINAYLISEEGWHLLNDGIAGRHGFDPCKGEDVPVSIPIPTQPTEIQELIGRPLRAYTTGAPLTEDHRPNRVNIETDKDGIIVQIWFG